MERSPGRWQVTRALLRALSVTLLLALLAIATGRPDLLALAAPFGVLAALGLGQRPTAAVRVETQVDRRWLREGERTWLRSRVDLDDRDEGRTPLHEALDHTTVTLRPSAYVVPEPATGSQTLLAGVEAAEHAVVVGLRRWGIRSPGELLVEAESRWGGFLWTGAPVPAEPVTVLPHQAGFRTAVDAPHPVGLIGANRSRRAGDSAEFYAVRPFQAGDRLRRINWRTSLRSGELHTTATDAQEDSSVMLVLDAISDVGASDGLGGRASSLDTTVRAASALSAHHHRVGDRVGVRVLGLDVLVAPSGSGMHHHRGVEEMLTRVRVGWPFALSTTQLRFRAGAGTVVLVLTPLLTPELVPAVLTLARRGLTVVVVDTLPPEALPAPAAEELSPGRLGWRMRLVERATLVGDLEGQGVPVVPWRGPGTLDEVLRQLVRRTRAPQEVRR